MGPGRAPPERVNPARAGMIRLAAPLAVILGGKPRASGDDPATRRNATRAIE